MHPQLLAESHGTALDRLCRLAYTNLQATCSSIRLDEPNDSIAGVSGTLGRVQFHHRGLSIDPGHEFRTEKLFGVATVAQHGGFYEPIVTRNVFQEEGVPERGLLSRRNENSLVDV
ncbi:hypothetical protein CRV24_010141 [Beauveria bassiana]|nr:hypothetical protein CRV24_010141 [Beauveria bassiana]KAH8713913.1 hypothetical protein HC256_007031 [Beauveria bassiana]